jgi:hypothetical protein
MLEFLVRMRMRMRMRMLARSRASSRTRSKARFGGDGDIGLLVTWETRGLSALVPLLSLARMTITPKIAEDTFS